MLSQAEKKYVSDLVDDYIDGLRIDARVIRIKRIIKENRRSEVSIIDTDLVIDNNLKYGILVEHPIEESFIPKEVDIYVTLEKMRIDRSGGSIACDFLNGGGVVSASRIPIDDPIVSDRCLELLISRMYFDKSYQESAPEVRTKLKKFYARKHSEATERIKLRLGPLLGLN